MRAWETAASEGLGNLLNLVADEHLERNLRALRRSHGDRFKRLARRSRSSTPTPRCAVDLMFRALGARAFQVLTAVRLEVARAMPGSVRVAAGRLLLELEKAGSSFGRFRAGASHGAGEPTWRSPGRGGARAVRKEIPAVVHEELLGVARTLRAIFGGEAALLAFLDQDSNLSPDHPRP